MGSASPTYVMAITKRTFPRNGETTENGLVERSSDRAASWSVSEVRASRSRRDLPTDFRVAPEVELSILAENSLFFEKNSLLGLQNSPFHC